jgi:hypothetical protein
VDAALVETSRLAVVMTIPRQNPVRGSATSWEAVIVFRRVIGYGAGVFINAEEEVALANGESAQ